MQQIVILVAGIMKDKLSYLIVDLLPIADEITGLFTGHYFRSLVFEDRHCDAAPPASSHASMSPVIETALYGQEICGDCFILLSLRLER